jgi:hypothetical protein
MDRIDQALEAKIQQKKLEIQEQNAQSLQELRQAKTEKAIQDMERIRRKDRLLETATNKKVMTDAGEMSFAKMMVYNNAFDAGLSPSEPEVLDFFQNPDGSVKGVVAVPGSSQLEVREFESLQDAQRFADKTVEMGPGEKTAARETAQLQTQIQSADWANDLRTNWEEANPNQARFLAFPGDQDQAKVAEAQKSLTERFKMALENVFPGEDIFVRGGDQPGFYSSQRGFLRTLPPGVDPQNVVDLEETEGTTQKGQTTQYSSPEEVRSAVSQGTLTMEEGREILVNNWPDRFK